MAATRREFPYKPIYKDIHLYIAIDLGKKEESPQGVSVYIASTERFVFFCVCVSLAKFTRMLRSFSEESSIQLL